MSLNVVTDEEDGTKPGDLLGGSALAVQHEVDLSSATTSGKMSVKEKGVSRPSF